MNKTIQASEKKEKGFTLIELLVVILITILFAIFVLWFVNPIEIVKQNRDKIRIDDLSNLQTAINTIVQESSASNKLCNGARGSCSGDSAKGTRAVNGTGWVKVDLTQQKGSPLTELPIDPINNGIYRYTYGVNATGTGYELDTVFESQAYIPKMTNDGGQDNNHYEVGTDLTAITP